MPGDLLARLRARDWRLSAQRRAVAQVLVGEHVHLTAEQVHALARERLPEISRATVYNALNELVAMGELLEVGVTDGPKRYDPNVAEPHDHLVCEGCQAIRDVPRSAPPPAVAEEARGGFLVTGVEVTYRGLCPACARRRRARPDPSARDLVRTAAALGGSSGPPRGRRAGSAPSAPTRGAPA
jgi:Fe2+ or Zn2+ uptake regulation protein